MIRELHRQTRRRGFSLIELMVAAAVSAVLMGGVLLVLGAFGRDRRRLAAEDARPQHASLIELLRRDLANAQTMTVTSGGRGFTLTGHGGIDRRSLSLTGRLTKVIYEVRGDRAKSQLVRRQEYVDDPIRRDPWTDLVGSGVSRISVEPAGVDSTGSYEAATEALEEGTTGANQPTRRSIRVPAKVRLHLEWFWGSSLDELLWLK